MRGCRHEGLWKPTVIIPYRKEGDNSSFVLSFSPWKNAEAELDVRFCSPLHKDNIDPDTLKEMGMRAFWSANIGELVSVADGLVTVRWDKANPGLIIRDGT